LQFFLGRRSARAERSSAQTGLTAATGAATQDARFPDDDLNIMVLANSGAFDYNSAVSAVYNVLVPSPHSASSSPSPRASARAKPVAGSNPVMTAAAERWLDDAVAGHIDLARMRPDARARMQPAHAQHCDRWPHLGLEPTNC
jgi:hypothetical protein